MKPARGSEPLEMPFPKVRVGGKTETPPHAVCFPSLSLVLCPVVELISEERVEAFQTADSLLIFSLLGRCHASSLQLWLLQVFPNCSWESLQEVDWGKAALPGRWGGDLPLPLSPRKTQPRSHLSFFIRGKKKSQVKRKLRSLKKAKSLQERGGKGEN